MSQPHQPASPSVPPCTTSCDLSWVPQGQWSEDICFIKEHGFPVQRDFIFSYLSAESNPNIRAIKQGQRLFYSGHVSSISLLCQGEYFYYRVTVLPSMKMKKYTPTFMIAKQGSKHKVTRAYCDCMGGITGACVHIATSLYALAYISDKPVPNRALASLGIALASLSCQWLPAQ